jgi:hypothetical protein
MRVLYASIFAIGARETSAKDVYSNPLNRPKEGTEAQLDPDWPTKYGEPVYVGPDGKLYDANGNPYTPKPPAPPPVTPPPPNTEPPPAGWTQHPLGGGTVLENWTQQRGGVPYYDPISKSWIGPGY